MTPEARLRAVWARSDRLIDLLDDAWLLRPIPLRHPFVFYRGHLAAFAWNQLGRGALGRGPLRADFDTLFERGIDPADERDAAQHTRPRWPDPADVEAYVQQSRDAVLQALPALDRIGDDPLQRNLRVVEIVAEHEEMHHETLLYMLQRTPLQHLRAPAIEPPAAPDPAPARVGVPAGAATLGARWDALPFGWDVEFPEVRAEGPAFQLDRFAVSVGRFEAFVADGGYARAELWDPDDWAWRERTGLAAPIDWVGDGVRWVFGVTPRARVAGWPVTVSFAEAQAFARWARGRLPTEGELHRAAEGTDRCAALCDLDAWHPRGVADGPEGGCGAVEVVGNVWAWTATDFAPRPGFSPWMRSYPGYSADFYDGDHRVVFGASWATARGHLRPSFRNWYQRRYPWVLAGFRVAFDG